MSKAKVEPPPSRLDERAPGTLAFGDFEFDEERWELRRNGTAIGVPPKVMQTIGILVRNRDRVVSNEELFATLWPDVVVTEASLAKSIRIARQILGDDGNAQQFIKTTRGRGYRFVAPVRESQRRRSTRPPPPVDDSPESDSSVDEAPLVGREYELKELRGALSRANGGRGSFFLVSGDVGAGKTRLLEAFGEHAAVRGARVVWGRGCEEGGAPELWPFRQILRSLPHEPNPALDSVFGLTTRADEDPTTGSASSHTEAARFRFFDSLAETLRQAAEEHTLVLVLEDLHGTDGATLTLTRFLARELSNFGVVLIGTYRPSDADSKPEIAESIGRLIREARTIPLSGLTENETAHLLETTLGFGPDRSLVSKVQQVTEGNPLFISEISRRLRSAGARSQDDIELPERVVEVIRGRLETLERSTRELLAVAAVIGRDFELPVLERVSGLSRESAVAALEPALDRRIVASRGTSPGSYRFSHTLYRNVLYEATGIARRAELHSRTGEAFEALSASGTEVPPALLAHHFRIAAAGAASPKAVTYAAAAGNQALRSFAFEEAAEHFDAALESLRLEGGKEALVVETLTSLGHAHRLAGNYSSAGVAFRRALSVAEDRSDSAGLARAALGFAQVNPETGNANREAMELLERTVPVLETAPDSQEGPLRGLLSMVLSRLSTCSAFAGRAREAEERSRRALDIARTLGEPRPLARALEARHWVLWKPGTAEERLSIALEMLELGKTSFDVSLVTEARIGEITDLLELGRRDAFDRALAQYERSAHESRDSNALYNVRVFETTRAVLEGRFASAERIAEEAFPIGSRIFPNNARNFYSAALLWIRLEQGRAHEIVDVYRAYFDHEPQSPLLRSTILRLYTEMGDVDSTRSELAAICPNGHVDLDDDWAFFATAAHLAAAAHLVRNAGVARALALRLGPYAESHAVIGPAVVYLGPVAFYSGLCESAMGDFDRAVASFERALGKADAMGARAVKVRIEYHLADALASRGAPSDSSRAIECVRRLLSTARELDMVGLAERAESLRQRLQEPESS